MSTKDTLESLDKVIDKISKLLAMANDTSSPNEALLAAKRARALMDKYQLSQEDIETQIGSQFLEAQVGKQKGKQFLWEKSLAAACANLNDCRSVINRNQNGSYLSLQGFKSDVIVAKMTMEYLVKAAKRAKDSVGIKGASESQFFMRGFSSEVLDRAIEIKRSREKQFTSVAGTGLVLLKNTEIEKHFGELGEARRHEPRKPLSIEERKAFIHGIKAGESISLDKQIDGRENTKLTI
ncbi:DUF2786 domain-containing protein [Vibrio sp. V31_P5A7T61]|uniref:DUF2786 domain-containing protein n=1 Tax=unclassified Vibrio TaxID=2614977 RepID=UPI001372E774|nr:MULTISPECIES: DUF2786 domain-containing protein [unclassified Vibrio]NAW61088.1 DUF2786 domain-containing protein [Vibrio sp. V31_P5A7T61]NAX02092.1 DUF2786 domain-containing protein [Vibrio sp. V34_P3A8T189]NAX07048.1 DUF2786 domain-containing protein [Vibrio sp. V40_P2S30T141]NAX63829.1 DUF2786 domain-containing protein [Vibrio sp. V32_P6A28T40]